MNKSIKILCVLALFLSGCVQPTLRQAGIDFHQKNYEQAFQNALPLAEQGNSNAQYAVGYMYYYGQGVSRNTMLAKQWIQKAADQGQPDAVVALKMWQ